MTKTQILEKYPHPKYPRLTVQHRTVSRFFQAVMFLDRRYRQTSTKTPHLPTAFKLTEDWYRRELKASNDLARQHPIAQITSVPTMGELYRSYRSDLPKHQQD